MTPLELEAWDAVWQRWYSRGLALNLTPNQSVHRADDEMTTRYGPRPEKETTT